MHFSDFPKVGDVFLGRYRVESILGAGGFARVYSAVQDDLDRRVAIKVMRPAVDTTRDSTEETLAQIEEVEERFRREARVISKFRSPNTVVVHDYGRTNGGLLFMTLEFVDGQTVGDVIKNDAPIAPARAVHILKQVLRSLHEAHSFDILHRDIKPQNIMVYDHLDQKDLVKVLDFGIAKLMEVEEEAAAVEELTTDGVLVGTPRYMSPEQIRGDRLTAASDIYSLGLVAFEMLSGAKAVNETTTMRIIARHLDPSPLRFPDDTPVGDGLRTIVENMIAKNPADRYETARKVLAAFDAWDPDEPVPVVPAKIGEDEEVAETVKFEAESPSQLDSPTEPEPQSAAPPAAGPATGTEAPNTPPRRDDDGQFFAADTQMLASDELPDPSWDGPPADGEPPRAQFFHPGMDTDDGRGETTGQMLTTERRGVPWLPIGIVAGVVVLLAGIAYAVIDFGDEEPVEEPTVAETTDGADDEEPPVAVADSLDDVIEIEPLEDPEADQDPESGSEIADAAAAQREESGESGTEAEDAADEEEVAAQSDETEADEGDSESAETAEPRERRRPRPRRRKKKQEKRRFFSVE